MYAVRKMEIVLLVIMIAMLNIGCFQKKVNDIDSYYQRGAGWDYSRIPLVKPFELIMMKGDSSWSINTSALPNQASDMSPIQGINVTARHIYGFKDEYQDSSFPEYKTPKKWFIIDVAKQSIEQYTSIELFMKALDQYKLPAKLLDPFRLQKEFVDFGILPWFPDSVKNTIKKY